MLRQHISFLPFLPFLPFLSFLFLSFLSKMPTRVESIQNILGNKIADRIRQHVENYSMDEFFSDATATELAMLFSEVFVQHYGAPLDDDAASIFQEGVKILSDAVKALYDTPRRDRECLAPFAKENTRLIVATMYDRIPVPLPSVTVDPNESARRADRARVRRRDREQGGSNYYSLSSRIITARELFV